MLSPNYVIQVFFQYCKRPLFKKSSGTYNAECPYCHEGKSAGKKRRFFYIPNEDHLYCHNCNTNRNGVNFIIDQTGKTFEEVITESANEHALTVEDIVKATETYKKFNPTPLPEDSINLSDPSQVEYYKNNEVVQKALEFIKLRRLDTAVNRPKNLWLSLTDFIHKNRVVFPYYSTDGSKIEFYQTRALYQGEDVVKYLSKTNSDRTVFNLDRVTPDLDYVFLQEGPIDSMFLRNSVALGGISPTQEQINSINSQCPFHTIVYVLDNQWRDKAAWEHTNKLLNESKNVFIWPKELIAYKDLNELCMALGRDEVKPEFIIKHTHRGMKGIVEFSQVKLQA